MAEPSPIEVHKALADDTRYRLYRYLRLSRPRGLGPGAVDPARPARRTPCARTCVASRRPASSRASRNGARRRWAGRRPCTPSSTREGARDATTGCSPTSWRAGHGRRDSASGRWRPRANGAPTSWGGRRRDRALAARAARTSRCCRKRSPRRGSTLGSAGAGAPGSTSRCATARSATCWTSTGSSCAPCIAGCSRACSASSRPPMRLDSFEPLADRSAELSALRGARLRMARPTYVSPRGEPRTTD